MKTSFTCIKSVHVESLTGVKELLQGLAHPYC